MKTVLISIQAAACLIQGIMVFRHNPEASLILFSLAMVLSNQMGEK
jgi:hypothetical protein